MRAVLTHKGTRELTTERLKLRPFRLSDAEFMFKNYATDERVTKFLSWPPYKSAEAIEPFLADTIESYKEKSTYHWAIEFGEEMIGSISVMSVDERNESCEIGYCIGYDFWNMGIVSEAVKTVMRFLFTKVGMRRIVAKHDVKNPASGRVMQKCGMLLEGRLRGHYLRRDGSVSDSLVYGILAEEFLAERT